MSDFWSHFPLDVTKALLVTELGSSRTPETVRTVLANMEKLLCLPIHG